MDRAEGERERFGMPRKPKSSSANDLWEKNNFYER